MWKTKNEKLNMGPVDTMFRDNGPNGGLVRVFP